MTQREDKDKNKVRREKLADHLYYIAKLSFAGLVVGGLSPILTGTTDNIQWLMVILGCFATFFLSYCANRVLKY